jgi:hypothetical protein
MNHLPLTMTLFIYGSRDSDTITMERRQLVPFVPVSGIKVRLYSTHDDDDEALEIDLDSVVFDMRESTFTIEVGDEDARTAWQQGEGEVTQASLLAFYTKFGFRRVYK